MEVFQFKTIQCGKGDTISIYPIGDIHAGTIHCVESDIKEKIREIKENPLAFWIGMGDLGEFITPSDKRWEPSAFAIAKWIQPDNIAECQRKWLKNLLKPIKDTQLLIPKFSASFWRFNLSCPSPNITNRQG